MTIELHPHFKKSYKKRIANNQQLVKRAEERLALFKSDPTNPILKDHQLSGAKSALRAFSISGDIRIIYSPVSNHSILRSPTVRSRAGVIPASF